MYLLIIILSFLLGCISTLALLLYLYSRYVLYSPSKVSEPPDEQYEPYQPLPESEKAKNSAVDTVNYIFQFLFQELKDTSRLRRYLMHKLNTEFNELKNSRTGKIFLNNIVIDQFSIGQKCPVFSDIQLERQERDENNRIKEFVAGIDADYQDGFSVGLDVTLLFGHKCRIGIKVKRIQGHLRLEFRREPFCHWLLVFQDEPTIDFEVKSYFATVERPQLANIITQQLRRAIKRKQTWPSYKIRYQPFFPVSKEPIATEILSANKANLIPGNFVVTIKYCDRLSIPFGIFEKEKLPSIKVFLTININEQTSKDYLFIDRKNWPKKEIELQRNVNKIVIKEAPYMDRTELLIDSIDPIPSSNPDHAMIKAALQEKNIFLLKVQGQEINSLKQANRLLKSKSNILTADTSPIATNGNSDDKINIVVGLPILYSVRLQRVMEIVSNDETEKTNDGINGSNNKDNSSPTLSSTLRQRTASIAVSFDKSNNSATVTQKPTDGEEKTTDENSTANGNMTRPQDLNATKKSKATRNPLNDITLMLMNADLLSEFQAEPTESFKAESHIDINKEFNFEVGEIEKFLNICLWCKPPLDCEVNDPGKKLILLGFATTALSELVLDAHMSFKRETQMTLNFCSAYSPKPNIKKRLELSAHKGYDDNLAHGFVTINVRHQPAAERTLSLDEKKQQFFVNGPVLNEICTKIKEKERTQEQARYIEIINAQHALPTRRPNEHIFEDKSFIASTLCAACHKKIWMKAGRQCRDCHITIHRKCEEKFNAESTCTHEPVEQKNYVSIASPEEDTKSLASSDLSSTDNVVAPSIENPENSTMKMISEPALPTGAGRLITPTTANRLSTKAAAAFSAIDSTARRSFLAFGSKNPIASPNFSPALATATELSKNEESILSSSMNASAIDSPLAKRSTTANATSQSSSKLANAASSAYSKLRELKTKRLNLITTGTESAQKVVSPSIDRRSTNISESDFRTAISNYLTDCNDFKSLEILLQGNIGDESQLYSKAHQVGPELFSELAIEDRKQKLDSEISKLQQEIELQCQMRDDMTQECDAESTDENEKRKLRAKIDNINEKIHALGALTILYCSGLKHCCTQLEVKENLKNTTVDDDEDSQYDDPSVIDDENEENDYAEDDDEDNE